MSQTRVTATLIVDTHLDQFGIVIPKVLIDAIDTALKQAVADERERLAQLLAEGSDGVGGDWEAKEAAIAARGVKNEN